jgi:hypothetical protein
MARHANFSRLLIMLPLLLAPALADAREPKPGTDTITVELRELEGKSVVESLELTVPIDGEIAGSVLLFDRLHRCRLEARPQDSSGTLELELRCRDKSSHDSSLELSVRRAFPLGDALVVGELEPSAETRIQVVATRH